MQDAPGPSSTKTIMKNTYDTNIHVLFTKVSIFNTFALTINFLLTIL